jgi:hypothetical protein
VNPLPLAFALLALAVAAPAADRRDRERECAAVKEKIRDVQKRLRRGYRAAEGVRLNGKLLELRKKRAKVCR